MARILWRSGKIALIGIFFILTLVLILYGVREFTLAQSQESAAGDSGPSDEQMAAWEEAAREHADNGEYDQAIEIYNSILSQYPGTAGALQARKQTAKLYIRSNNIPAAESATDALVREFSQHSETARFLYEIALTYKQNGMAQNANALHQYNVDNFPDSMHAMRSQVEIIGHYIQEAEEAAAHAEFDRLMEIFAAQETLPREVCQIAKRYARADMQDKAIELYQYVATAWPEDEYALWSLQGEAITWIKMYQVVAAQVVIENLLMNFTEHKKLAPALIGIAQAYHQVQDDEKALEYYQYVVEHWPDTEHALSSLLGITKIQIANGELDSANSLIDMMKIEFSRHKGLPFVLFNAGLAFFRQNEFEQAIQVLYYLYINYPEARINAETPYIIALCYKGLKDYPMAIEFYKELLDKYPNSIFAYRAPSSIGSLLRKLNQYEDAIYWLNQQYKLYSDKNLRERSLFELGCIYKVNLKDYHKAAEYYQVCLSEYPNGHYTLSAIRALAQCYVFIDPSPEAMKMLKDARSMCESEVIELLPINGTSESK